MQTTLRNIGNSRGVIIPASVIEQLHIENEVDMVIEDGALILKPFTALREGWFEGYDADKDVEPLSDMKELESEQADWQW